MLDRLCLEFIVRHQPAAAHLRFVYAASKIVNLLERVGDYAESIARQTLLLPALDFELPLEKYREIANLAIPMLHDAVHAFVNRDAALARSTMAVEPKVNQVRDTLTNDLITLRERGSLPLEALTPLITVARRFERVSDQATNICEQALYFATGEYMRHQPREGFRVLFVDRTNGALSRIAEAVACALEATRFTFESAGIAADEADPETVRFLASKGFDVSSRPSRTLNEVPALQDVQVIVALCREAEAVFPERPSKTLALRWLVIDPSNERGGPEAVRTAYERTYQSLTNHVRDLVKGVLETTTSPTYNADQLSL
jgi:phosphate transport system protein